MGESNIYLDAYILHHSADFDGYGSATVAIKYLEIIPEFVKINTTPVNHNIYNINRIIENMNQQKNTIVNIKQKDYKRIIFVLDFCFNEQEMERLIEESDIFIFCEHHEPVTPIYQHILNYAGKLGYDIHDICSSGTFVYQPINKYNVLKLDHYIKKESKQLLINFLPTNESAACKLTYILLFQTNLMPIVLEHINDIDLYNLKNEETIYFREFLDKLPWKNYKFLKQLIFDNSITNFNGVIDTIPLPEIYSAIGKLLRERKTETLQRLLQRFIEIKIPTFSEYRACICNNTNGSITSELLNTMCSQYGYDIAISYYDDLVSNNRVFSMRTNRDDIDLNDIINKLFPGAGRGHRKSVGFTLSLGDGQNFLNNNRLK